MERRMWTMTIIASMAFSAILCTPQNIWARLSDAERQEFEQLQEEINANEDVAEEKLERWEELLLKDPELLQQLRQQAIDAWKKEAKTQGQKIDETRFEKENKRQWNQFLQKRSEKIVEANERAAVELLRAIRQACAQYKAENKEYPAQLADMINERPSLLNARLVEKAKQGYAFEYTRRGRRYSVLARPKVSGSTGVRVFLLDGEGMIRFTLDGSIPTPQSRLLL